METPPSPGQWQLSGMCCTIPSVDTVGVWAWEVEMWVTEKAAEWQLEPRSITGREEWLGKAGHRGCGRSAHGAQRLGIFAFILEWHHPCCCLGEQQYRVIRRVLNLARSTEGCSYSQARTAGHWHRQTDKQTHTHTMDICRRTTISKVTLETGSMKIVRNVSDVYKYILLHCEHQDFYETVVSVTTVGVFF